MKERSLLVCGAHPDDELFVSGSIAMYAADGVRVTIVCATRGERGRTADLCSIEELPAVREAELRAATRILGVDEAAVRFLPYEDKQLGGAPIDEVRKRLAGIIREVRPQVVVSFDLYGLNGHPDHVAMARFTADASAAAADARFYPDAGDAHQVRRLLWAPPVQPWTVAAGFDFATEWGIDFLIQTEQWAQQKCDAIRAHRTQLPSLETLFFKQGSPAFTLNQEAFRLAWGPRAKTKPSADLFDGL